MNINNFLKIPLVKIVVTVLFLLYIYDKTKDDPRTASYQISKANIGESIDNIKYAMKVAKDSASSAGSENSESDDGYKSANKSKFFSGPIVFNDVVVGDDGPQAVCGSQVVIQYSLIEKDNQNLVNQSNMSLKIGSGFNQIIEKGILGMRAGGIRTIDIPSNFSSGDVNYDNLIKNKSMIYKIMLIIANDPQDKEARCE